MNVIEAAAHQSRYLAAIVEALPDLVGVSRGDGQMLYLNAAGRRLLGIPPEADITALNYASVCPSWVFERTQSEWLPRAMRDGSVSGEGAIRTLDGREIPVAFALHVHRAADGSVEALSTIAREVTERRRAEEALRRSDERLRRVIESNIIGVVVADFTGHIREANQAFLQMVGYTAEDVRAGRLNFIDLTPAEYAELDRQAMQQMHAEGRHVPFEKEYIRKDGTRVPVVVGTVYLGAAPDGTETGMGFLVDLTERRGVEQQLRRSEERFRSLMEQAPFSVQIFAPDGHTLSVNRAWEELWGATIETVATYNILEDQQLEARGVLPLIQRAFQGDIAHIPAIEYDPNVTLPDSSRHADSRRWVSAVAYPLKDGEGRVREVVLVHEDVTARTKAELALRESDEQFRLLADTMPQLTWMAQPDGHIFWYNRRWYEYTGTTPEQMDGWGWQSVHDPEVLPRVLERWKASIATGEPFDMVFPLRGADGVLRPFLTRVNPLCDAHGVVKRWFGTNTDISEQKQAEDASRFLADASSTLASVVDYHRTLEQVAQLAVPRFADWCAVDMVELDGTLRRLAVAHADAGNIQVALELSQRGSPRHGVPFDPWRVAATGQSELHAVISDDTLRDAAHDSDQLRMLRGLGLRSYICVPMRTRGETVGVISFAVAGSGRQFGSAQLALAEQLAGRAAVAIENARLYAELREADQRKDEFLATLAHELRNPLAPIRTSLEILRMPAADPSLLERSREIIERQVTHLARLVEDLLDVSRVMRGKIELRRERVSLSTVVAHAIETALPVLDTQAQQLTVAIPAPPIELDADPVRLGQVIGNLLTNAAKYTPRGGHIGISAAVESGRAVIRVRDNGVGIAPALLPRVFDLFVQADDSVSRSQGGLGIGLTLVKSLVEMHGGTVEARSDGAGQGSEFIVRLPVSRGARPSTESPPSPAPEATQRRSLRVLVVDDNVDGADTLAALLSLLGQDVQVAHAGPAALVAAREFRPHLVLLDLGMPGMDGYQVVRALRADPNMRAMRIVAVTGWGQEQDRRRTAEAGFDEHLVKPVDPAAIERLLTDTPPSPSSME